METRQLCEQTARKHRQSSLHPRVSSLAAPTVPGMSAIAVIHILCEGNPSLGTAVVNGLLAWASWLGACTVFFSGLPAAVALFIPSRPDALARRINRGLGIGLVAGMGGGPLMCFVFIDRVVS